MHFNSLTDFLRQEKYVESCKSTAHCQLYSSNKEGSKVGIHTLTHSVYVPHEFFLENISIGPYFKELLALGNYLGVLKTQIGFISN